MSSELHLDFWSLVWEFLLWHQSVALAQVNQTSWKRFRTALTWRRPYFHLKKGATFLFNSKVDSLVDLQMKNGLERHQAVYLVLCHLKHKRPNLVIQFDVVPYHLRDCIVDIFDYDGIEHQFVSVKDFIFREITKGSMPENPDELREWILALRNAPKSLKAALSYFKKCRFYRVRKDLYDEVELSLDEELHQDVPSFDELLACVREDTD